MGSLSECGPEPALSILNPHPVLCPGPQLLHQLVRSTGVDDRSAIEFLNDKGEIATISYQSLHSLSEKWSLKIRQLLHSRLSTRQAVIPVFLPQSCELYIALLAILKAGGAFCPLSLDAPSERLKFIIDDISAPIVITNAAFKGKIPGLENVFILLTDDPHEVPNGVALPSVSLQPRNLAYVQYTSGSTGQPKGVGITHLAASQSLLAHEELVPEFTRFLQFAAPTFDVSIFEIFFPWTRGLTLCACERASLLNDLPRAMNALKVDAAELTPTVAGTLLRTRANVPRLNLLLTIGEMLTRSVVDEFGGSSSRKSILWGMYGPTEAAIHCTLQPEFQSNSQVGNIGRPFRTVSAFIATPASDITRSSDSIEILPIGNVGELVIGGSQLAEKYINRPEETAKAFINSKSYGPIYRTGDKARMLPDGTIECLGRIATGQVKLRGQRIELGEIEQAISRLEGCLNVTASVISNTLVAFCLMKDSSITVEDVMEVSRKWLPTFMVPGDIVLLQGIPRLPSGKVDRKLLEQQYVCSRSVMPEADEGFQNDAERKICEALGRVLHHPINMNTQLLSLGLDSLTAISSTSELRSSGFIVSVVDVLQAKTPKEILSLSDGTSPRSQTKGEEQLLSSERLTQIQKKLSTDSEVQIDLDDIEQIYPCTPIQSSMLVETSIRKDAYCNWVELQFPYDLSKTQIRSYFFILAAENSILRSGFVNVDGSFHQIVWKKLLDVQVQETDDNTKSYALETAKDFLRPLQVQILGNENKVIWRIPHFVYDGWSMDLLLHDLSTLVKTNTATQRPQYFNITTYYSQLTDSQLEPTREYWRRLLADYNPVSLPNFNGELLSEDSLDRLNYTFNVSRKHITEVSRRYEISPQVYFQAAMVYLLSAYSGSTDVVLGTVSSGRTIPVADIEKVVGPCISTLPLRVNISDYKSVRQLLQSVHNSNRMMLRNTTLPVKDIKRLANVRPGDPLFDTLFVWQESLESKKASVPTVRQINSADELEFKLTLEVEPYAQDFTARATFQRSSVGARQVKFLFKQMDQIVQWFVENIDAGLGHATDAFDISVTSVFNQPPQLLKSPRSPAHSVEEFARSTPHKDALSFSYLDSSTIKTAKLSYEELNSRSNKLAHLLLTVGVQPDQNVCICMEKSINLYVAILAVIKTGAGYLPITPETPQIRVKAILEQAGVQICISESSVEARLRLNEQCSIVDMATINLDQHDNHNLGIPYCGSHVAYTIFTSGSTGTPKGVLVTYENLVSNLKVLADIYPTPQGSRLLQSCSQAFDVSVFEIFFTWYTGMCLCSASKEDLFQDIERMIKHLNITHLSLTPTVASLIDPSNVPSVHFLVTAGEAVTEKVMKSWADKGLFQGYGPSETTNICTVKPNVSRMDLINNIGRPLVNTSAFVFDQQRATLIPRGGVGELCFGGDQVFRGYLNMPDLTASKIINHPEFGRVYRSGDLGRMLPDGTLVFVGRVDDQVKIRGQRVELGEINNTVLSVTSVDDCVTLLISENAKPQRLITFWVSSKSISEHFSIVQLSETIQTLLKCLYESLRAKLPTYMVPSSLIPVSKLPMTTQGKIDKRKLIAEFRNLDQNYVDAVSGDNTEVDDSETWSNGERDLAKLIAGVVKVSPNHIKRRSSLFSVGLDSISAISISREIKRQLGRSAPVSTILKDPTIAQLNVKLGLQETSTPIGEFSLKQVFEKRDIDSILRKFEELSKPVQKVLPCTPLQEAMLSATSSGSVANYRNRMLFLAKGDNSVLLNAWVSVMERHEIFRTVFYPTNNRYYAFAQVVLSASRITYNQLVLKSNDLDDTVEKLVEHVIASKFDALEPPYSLTGITTEDQNFVLFSCHHALYDGIAIEQLLYEVEQVYSYRELPKPVSYGPFMEEVTSLDREEAATYWTSLLQDFEPSVFPPLHGKSLSARKNLRSRKSYTGDICIPLDSLDAYCQRFSCTLLALAQAAWVQILSIYIGESDICFGNVVSGRALPIDDLERLVAPCFNTLPVRIDLNLHRKNVDLVNTLHTLNIQSLPFQLTPLRHIQNRLVKDGERLFDTLFILQKPSRPLDKNIWTLVEDVGEMDFPLVCELAPNRNDNRLILSLHYHNSIISDTDITNIFHTYAAALTSCVKYPQGDVLDFPDLQQNLCSIANSDFTMLEPKTGYLLHSAFENNVQEFPNTLALSFQHDNGSSTHWTFDELNRYANKIAHALCSRDVQVDEAVPICLPKSPLYYACVLGILKAGGAFTPIDPNLPAERKAMMVEELKAKVMLFSGQVDISWSDQILLINADEVQSQPEDNVNIRGLKPSNLAYRLYTSGSTGKPKAVSVEHRSPVQTIENSRSIVPWRKNSRLLQFAAITFDMCYYDCFMAWSYGFTLCAATQNAMLNDLSGIINSTKITMLDLTPSVARGLRRSAVPSVEYLYCIGETMSQQLIDEWEDICVNSYGPTEAAFCCTIFPVTKEVKPSVIGNPFPSTSFHILSKDGRLLVPKLGIGELYIGGAQLAREYHANDKLTNSAFITRDKRRLYKSGDLARMLSNGTIEWIGRSDDQIKIRGLRVELDEISNVVKKATPTVKDVTTILSRISDDSKEQLVTFLTTKRDVGRSDESTIKKVIANVCRKLLPSYMVPNFFIFVESFPLSAAGKVNRKALNELFREKYKDEDRDEDEDNLESQWSQDESALRDILTDLSPISSQRIIKSQTIYQLGLDSISAVQIASRLRESGRKVSAADVLSHPKIADLVKFLNDRVDVSAEFQPTFDFQGFHEKFSHPVYQTYKIQKEDVESIFPCTPLQQGILAQFLQSGGLRYYNSVQFKVPEGLTGEILQGAFEKIVERYQILRTGFTNINDPEAQFVMVTYQPGVVKTPVDVLSSEDDGKFDVRRWRENSAAHVLDSIHLPPWRSVIHHIDNQLVFDLSMLHALYDARSLSMILDDLALVCHNEQLPELDPIEPVLGTILHAGTSETEDQKQFWKDISSDILINRFPNMSPLKVDVRKFEVAVRVCSRKKSDLEAACREANITIQAAGQAAWARILSSYIGEPSVTFGVVLSGRTIDGAESAAIPCITTIPVSAKNRQSNRELLDSMMHFNVSVQNYQFTPLNKIQRWANHTDVPLFDTIFAYQKISGDESRSKQWELLEEEATADYAVSLELEPISNDELRLRLTFTSDLLPKEQAELLLRQYERTFMHLVSTPNGETNGAYVDDSSILSVTPAREPELMSEVEQLHQFVEHTARKSPQKVAFEFATSVHDGQVISRTWTYRELDEICNQIANLLVGDRQVEPGKLIAICFEKCPEASFAMIGILKAGCAFVALDPTAPEARKRYILEDSKAVLVLSLESLSKDIITEASTPVINLDHWPWQDFSSDPPQLSREVSPQDLSYCLYTSGTTGTPKGCELTHENAVQALLSFKRIFGHRTTEDSRWLQFASFHFDVSILEQFWSWSIGIRVVSAPRDVIFEDLPGTIRKLKITHLDLTPSLAKIIHPDDVPALCSGVFITGGEQLKQEILDIWGPKGAIHNGYGPTETTIGVTMYPEVPVNGKPSNIGPQFLNVGSYVLHPGTQIPVLRGAVGELCVSGKLVGKGYLNRPDLTKERFPTLEKYGERVYRTGDLVRILYDNTFDFLGRIDDQVKLRGQRLEIGEINSVIKQGTQDVTELATLVLKHPKQQREQLVSFVVTSDWRHNGKQTEPEIDYQAIEIVDEVQDTCRARLPVYMVPTHVIPLTSMPLSANNKADSRKLKDLFNALSSEDLQKLSNHGSAKDNNWSPDEEKIRDILAKMTAVEVEVITRYSSIFELGLDSISAIGFTRELKNTGYPNAQTSLVMQNGTIRSLAKALSSSRQTSFDEGFITTAKQQIAACEHRYKNFAARYLKANPMDIESVAPCTPLQQGIISRSLENDKPLYFNTFHFNLDIEINIHTLHTSWQSVYNSIQILRTYFVPTDDGHVQVALRNPPLLWNVIRIEEDSGLHQVLIAKHQDWWQANRNSITRPFELVLIRAPSKIVLAVHLMHALYDGNSFPRILQLVEDVYRGKLLDTCGPPFQEALPYGPLRETRDAEAFWTKHLDGVAFNPIPVQNPNVCEKDLLVTKEFHNFDKLEPIRKSLNVTTQAIVQAAWMTVLSQLLQSEVTVGMVVSGRTMDFEGAEQVIGPLFNTIPFSIQLTREDEWFSAIQKCHDFNVSAIPFQHTPLRNIMKWCKRVTGNSLFDTLFVFQKAIKKAGDSDIENLWIPLEEEPQADYPLALEVEQRQGNALFVTLVAQGRVVDQATLNKLLSQFEVALCSLLEDPKARISRTFDLPVSNNRSTSKHKSSNDMEIAVNGTGNFNWTSEAKQIRSEIVTLAGADREEIGPHMSILELGLDSIDAIKLSSRLKKHGLNLSVSAIMRAPTISQLAELTSKQRNVDEQGQIKGSVLREDEEKLRQSLSRGSEIEQDVEHIFPATPLQEGMVAEMLNSGFRRYYNHDVLKLSPSTDVEKLKKAWQVVWDHIPILRTTFERIDDPDIDTSFAQIVHGEQELPWEARDLAATDDIDKLIETLREDAEKENGRGRLFQLTLIQTVDGPQLIISIAHSLYDGWSLSLLHHDVSRAYQEENIARTGYQNILEEILDSSRSEAHEFWRDFLSGATPTVFPRNRLGEISSTKIHRQEHQSSVNLNAINTFCKREGITFQAVGQLCWSFFLASFTHRLDIVFGVVLSGRDGEDANEIIFPTMNTVAVRSILHGSRKDMLQYMQNNMSNIRQYQHFPLRKAQAMMKSHKQGIFDSLFIYQKHPEVSTYAYGPLYESVGGASDVEYPVCVEAELVPGGLIWRTACSDEVFNEEEVTKMLHSLDVVLENIISEVTAPALEFNNAGVSVCGLPTFKEDNPQTNGIGGSNRRHDSVASEEWTDTELAIRAALSAVSKMPENEITKDMDVFNMGLDSISAIKVTSLLRKESIKVSVSEMLKAGTIQAIAQIIDGDSSKPSTTNDSPDKILSRALMDINIKQIVHIAGLSDDNVETVLPATAGQAYMFSNWQNTEAQLFYAEFIYQIKRNITIKQIQKAWESLVQQTPILRTLFVATNDRSVPLIQLVLKEVAGTFHQGSPDSTPSFQPLVRLYAMENPQGWTLTLKIHHALYDGVSLPIIVSRLQALCRNEAQSLQSTTLESTKQFLTLTHKPDAMQARRAFWSSYLKNAQNEPFAPQPLSTRSRRIEMHIPRLLSKGAELETLARKEGVSVQALFLAVYARAHIMRVSSDTSSTDVVIGIYLANRAHVIADGDLSGLPFPTLNIVPLRISTGPETLAQIAKAVQDDLQKVSGEENAGVGLWEIREWTGIKVDVVVNFLKLPEEDVEENIEEGIVVYEDTDRRKETRKRYARVVEPSSGTQFTEFEEMKKNLVRDAFLRSVDIEATIRDGGLDVGVFAPEEMLDIGGAEKLTQGVGDILTELIENENV
ncbi:nonribosomal peptide synthetase 2 [Patellaria atrata CBS 101060]|uniref:Nonribosomal peptide synthetase 2 n=1 Tax=Patellaria atrata CBS 101060 TaxID=1346257 RepID=A0A9P4SIU7_9PEZI|nr:nonribosomal peptide synthetase 2 [Patellaria atrata CBS 101060]